MNDIQSRVLIVKPSVTMVGKSKTDKKLTDEVKDNHDLGKEAGQWVTKLWPPSFITPFTKLCSEAINSENSFHKRHTVISQFGYLLPTSRFEEYRAYFDNFEARFNALADDFANRYPEILEKARIIHNGEFREEHYPLQSEIRSKFSFTLFTAPVPRTTDLAVSYLDDARIDQIRADIERNVNQAARQASEQVMARVLDCVHRIAAKLSDPDAIFRDTLIGNLRDILTIAPELNIANNPRITDLIGHCQALMRDPETLRQNKFTRQTTAAAARNIADSFGAMGARKLAA